MENELDWNDVESMTVTLTLEDGSEMDCEVITVFDYEGDNYIAVVSSEELEGIDEDSEDEEGVSAMLYRLGGATWEEMELLNIDDDIYDKVAERFEEMKMMIDGNPEKQSG